MNKDISLKKSIMLLYLLSFILTIDFFMFEDPFLFTAVISFLPTDDCTLAHTLLHSGAFLQVCVVGVGPPVKHPHAHRA